MIDDPRKIDLLMSMLTESLPIEANITPYLAGELMRKSPDIVIPNKCNVTNVLYTGLHWRHASRSLVARSESTIAPKVR